MRRNIGNSGLSVAPIGLGGMPMSIGGRPSEADALRTIHAALGIEAPATHRAVHASGV